MTKNIPLLARNYRTALRKHLEDQATSDLAAARRLGERAARLGLETLDLARIHEEALLTVLLPHHTPSKSQGMIRRCLAFFAEAATPVGSGKRGTPEARQHLEELLEALTERTLELANSNASLQQEVARRRQVEDSLRVSETTTSQLLEKSRRMQEELRLLSRRLFAAQEEERRRISRDLHDILAQTLSGINLRLAALKSQSKASTRDLHQKIAATQRMVEKSVVLVHRFARDLRPAVLDDLGLIPALRAFVKKLMKDDSLVVSLTTYPGLEKLPGDMLTALYRVVQEALTNVVRHAKASRVTVRFYEADAAVCLRIHDNGRGFVVRAVNDGRNGDHLGLLGIRERVEMVGGSFAMQSAPGKGTTLHIKMPLRTPGKTDDSAAATLSKGPAKSPVKRAVSRRKKPDHT
jgi:signal transduction histidine kinase